MILTDNLNLAQYLGTDSAVPYDVAKAIKAKVQRDRELRNINMEKHWEMYQGFHSTYFNKRKNEDNELFGYRKKQAVIANYSRYVVDLSAKYLYGRASKVSRKFGENKNTDNRMRKITKLTNHDSLMLEASKKAGVFGEVGIRLIPIDEVTMEQVAISTDSTYPHPVILDPTKTFILLNKWGKIIAVVIEDEYKDWITGVKHTTVELVTQDSRWFWDDLGNSVSTVIPKYGVINDYQLNHEFVLMKNNDFWTDDIQDIIGLNIQMDEVLTDNAHFFAKHGWPQLVSSVDLSKVQHNASHIWTVESDGPQDKIQDKLFFLQWDGRMTESHEFVQYLESLIFKVSSTARIATGDLEAIGQLRSGPAIVAAHSPSIQKTQEKQVVWTANEIALLTAIACFDAYIHSQAKETRYPDLDINIVFPRDFAPGEELVRAEVQMMQINSHTRTIRDMTRENHPEFNEEQVDEYRDELLEDAESLVDSTRKFETEGGEGAAAPAKPKGQSGSATKKSKEQS